MYHVKKNIKNILKYGLENNLGIDWMDEEIKKLVKEGKSKEFKSELPSGVLPFKIRMHLAREMVRVIVGMILGDEWTKNIATDKDVQICFRLKKELREKVRGK